MTGAAMTSSERRRAEYRGAFAALEAIQKAVNEGTDPKAAVRQVLDDYQRRIIQAEARLTES